jgi:CubicO group peptidase (beta-lactamase class C family)
MALAVLAAAPPLAAEPALTGRIDAIAGDAMARYHLMALIVRVTKDGRPVYERAFGRSMSGVPATPEMHFRNGAMAFTYLSTLMLVLADRHELSLDDPLSKWFPDLPSADHVKLRNLADMTSGYADYVYQPEVLKGVVRDPFRQWTSDELIHIGVTAPMNFAPGTNWGYSHTNYVILGRVLEMAAHKPLNAALEEYVFRPMRLTETRGSDTPEVPPPVLHSFSSERREDLAIPPATPFYEETTYWNPSWTTAPGAVETTDIADLTRTMEAVGTGEILTPASLGEQVGPHLVGFGHADPACPVCRPLTYDFHYGMGVVLLGPWVAQTKSFAGAAAAVGYYKPGGYSVAVVTTYGPAAFDDHGGYTDGGVPTFIAIGNLLAPGTLNPPKK